MIQKKHNGGDYISHDDSMSRIMLQTYTNIQLYTNMYIQHLKFESKSPKSTTWFLLPIFISDNFHFSVVFSRIQVN